MLMPLNLHQNHGLNSKHGHQSNLRSIKKMQEPYFFYLAHVNYLKSHVGEFGPDDVILQL